jgi:hypothetical protein
MADEEHAEKREEVSEVRQRAPQSPLIGSVLFMRIWGFVKSGSIRRVSS